jgi:uncharacterized protein (TIRG00374 family)
MNKKRVLTTAVVIIVLGVLVYFQVQHWRTFDWARFKAETRGISKLRVLFAIVLVYCTYLLRAIRWKVFLKPICKARVKNLIGPTLIGFTGLALLGRPGEFVRPYLIAKRENVSLSSQIGVWTVERIFDIGAFTVLLLVVVFVPGSIQSNPYIDRFREAALVLAALVLAMSALCYLIRTRGPRVANFLCRAVRPISKNLARQIDQKTRAFGVGLNTIQNWLSFLQVTALSLAIWFLIALAYREVTHAYAYLSHLDVPHVILLIGFSMAGSIVQLPAVGGGSQLAVISALQVIYGIPPELAVSCGILLWLVTFITVVPVGLVLAHREQLSLRKVSHEAHEEEELEEQAPGFGLQAPGENPRL